MSELKSIHLVCHHQKNWRILEPRGNQFETGAWVISDQNAVELLGKYLYLHESQDAPAWHGGRVIDWRYDPEESKRKFFTYVVDKPFRVRNREAWGREMAIVRSE